MPIRKSSPSKEERLQLTQLAIAEARKRYAKLRASKDWPTPWESVPWLPCNDMGWRMGGEGIMGDWFLWIGGLTEVQFADYCARHRPVAPATPPTENAQWAFRDAETAGALAHLTIRTWPEWFDWVIAQKRGKHNTRPWEEYWDERLSEMEEMHAKYSQF